MVGLARPPGDGEQALLHERHVLDRQLDAEVAAGDHDPVGRVDDLLAVGGRLRLLDLGDQRHVHAALGEVVADRVEVLAPAHEREGEEVHAHLDPRVDQRDVLRTHRRQRDRDVGQVEPLARRYAAADLDPGHDVGLEDLVHAQPHRAVGQVADVAGVDELVEALPGDRQPLRSALDLRRGEHDSRPAAQLGHAVGHRPEPQLGPGQVAEDGHLASRALGGGADHRGGLGVLGRRPVGEVQPRHIHPGGDHRGQDIRVLRGWTDGCDDLRGAHDLPWNIPGEAVGACEK